MSIEKSALVAVRNAVPGDKNFIMATWLKGLKHGNDWFNAIDQEVYFNTYNKIIEAILDSPGVQIKVACLKEDPDVILGYSVFAADRLDWVFCKKIWRGIGIARSLVPESIKTVSHLTVVGKSILRKRDGIKFNPFSV